MKKIHIHRTIAAVWLAMASLLGCKPQLDAPTPSGGTADFTRYIAVGNSLTAGYADNGLYRAGQLNSYPGIIAGQLQKAGGAAQFRQPLFPENQANGTGYLTLTGITSGLPTLQPVAPQAVRGRTTPDPLNNPAGVLLTKYTEPIENYGIPNIRVFDVADTRFSAQNPFYERILTEAESGKSYLEKVTETAHTFFSCWMGSNDVLLYAVSGGQVPITPPGTFSSLYTLLINNLMRNGAKGVVADIPSVTSIPFLTTLGPQVKSTLSQANIPGIFAQSGPSQNPTVIQVPTSSIASSTGGTVLFPLTASTYASLVGQRTGGYWREFAASQNRQLTEVLTQYNLDTTQAFGFHPRNPWPTSLILDAQEVATANTAVASFNQTIKTTADSKGLAFVDANALLQRFQTGSIYNGVGINAAFITGGLFSLDGVHLTPKGYAIAANEFIKATNARYGSTIPLVDVNNYPAVRFP